VEKILKYFPGLTSKQIEQFAALKDLYIEWNKKINVISRKDMDNFYERHVLHSLAIAKKFSFSEKHKIMDLGSGGGFPGIPLGIIFPAVTVHLVDSINKKLKVASEIASTIGLLNITMQQVRAEELKEQQFDVVVSRAVAPLKDLWKWSKPLLVNGHKSMANGLICLKGGDLQKEISESGQTAKSWEIEKIFEEEFFREKYILYIQQS
jgi:16S rRNA (guanine527-N7)-methyltransferase